MYVSYVQFNNYLLSYLLQGGRSIQSLRVRDFEPMHMILGRASTGSEASGLGIPSGAFLQPLNKNKNKNKHKNNVATARRSSPSVVNSRPTTVARRSHSASSFVRRTMTTGCYTQRVARSVVVSQDLLTLTCDGQAYRASIVW